MYTMAWYINNGPQTPWPDVFTITLPNYMLPNMAEIFASETYK